MLKHPVFQPYFVKINAHSFTHSLPIGQGIAKLVLCHCPNHTPGIDFPLIVIQADRIGFVFQCRPNRFLLVLGYGMLCLPSVLGLCYVIEQDIVHVWDWFQTIQFVHEFALLQDDSLPFFFFPKSSTFLLCVNSYEMYRFLGLFAKKNSHGLSRESLSMLL